MILDLPRVAKQRKPVNFDRIRSFNQDEAGNQIDPNLVYGIATAYQPPMAVRVGAEVSF